MYVVDALPTDEKTSAKILGALCQQMRGLAISDNLGFLSPNLSWPSLEFLKLSSWDRDDGNYGVQNFGNFTSSCPQLKRAIIEILDCLVGPVELIHDTLKELEV